MEQADKKPLVALKLREIPAISPQMGDGVALAVVLVEVRDTEVRWKYSLWKVAEVTVFKGLALVALH